MEIYEIIVRVLSGNASEEDKQSLMEWLQEDNANSESFKETESLWNALEIINNRSKYYAEKAFGQFENKINANTHEFVTPRGSKAHLVLSDGTKIWLNADSRLSYSEDFNKESREVSLEGEGYFEVTANAEKIFTVNASGLIVKALGATFNVLAYSNKNSITTTLIDGVVDLKIKSGDDSNEVISTLLPNQEAVFFKDFNKADSLSAVKQLVEIHDLDDAYLAGIWTENIMIFKNESFYDLAHKLERRFDVTIHFMDENIKEVKFSGKFEDVIIEELLEALKFSSPFDYYFDNKDIYISYKQTIL